MAKPPKQLVPSLAPVSQPQPPVQAQDLHNLVVAARQALPQLTGEALGHVVASIQRVEAALAAMKIQTPATDGAEKKAVP